MGVCSRGGANSRIYDITLVYCFTELRTVLWRSNICGAIKWKKKATQVSWLSKTRKMVL